MGSPPGETGRRDDEQQVDVHITQPFWLAETQFTQAQWQALMGTEPSHFKGADKPVEKVSWHDCVAAMEKLNTLLKGQLPQGYAMGLPTEAQWEYACRAGTTTAYHYGDTYDENAQHTGGETVIVKSYQPNAFGLYDMHGNVFEWCRDAWDEVSKLLGGQDPESKEGGRRVRRGGSWYINGWLSRSAYRLSNTPEILNNHLGFRPSAGRSDS